MGERALGTLAVGKSIHFSWAAAAALDLEVPLPTVPGGSEHLEITPLLEVLGQSREMAHSGPSDPTWQLRTG